MDWQTIGFYNAHTRERAVHYAESKSGVTQYFPAFRSRSRAGLGFLILAVDPDGSIEDLTRIFANLREPIQFV
jgi:hypothetical protein